MLLSYHYNIVSYIIIVVDEKLHKLGHKEMLLKEGIRKVGDSSGIPSLHIGSGRVCCLIEVLSCLKLNSECSAVYQIAVTLIGSHNLLVTDGIWALD